MNTFSLSTLHKRLYLLSPILRSRIGIALIVLLTAGAAQAAEIYVDGVGCQLGDAIIAANTDQALYGCAAGAGADTLILTRDIKLQLGDLPTITSDISIEFTDLAAQDCDNITDDPPDDPNDDPPGSDDPPGDPDDDPPGSDDPPGDPDDNDEPPPDNDDPPKNPPSVPPTDTATAPPTSTAPPTDTATAPPASTPPPTDTATAPPTNTATPFGTATITPTGTATPTGTTSVTPTLPGTSTGTPGATVEPTIPEYCLHTVARDETLFRIALRYELTVNQFSTFNNLQSVNRLDVGQELIIPSEACMQYVPRKG